jgi:hypothetical protein
MIQLRELRRKLGKGVEGIHVLVFDMITCKLLSRESAAAHTANICMCACMWVCMNVCMTVCMYKPKFMLISVFGRAFAGGIFV